MNRKMAFILAVCLLSVGLLSLVPSASAQVYDGSVMTTDASGNPKDYFDRDESVYYEVQATIDGNYLQDSDIDIDISGPNGIVHESVITTDDFGVAKGSWIYYFWEPERDFGYYTIYANFTSHHLGNFTFIMYTPVPETATVITYANNYRKSGGTPTIYFNSDDRVYFSIYVLDQYENPFAYDGDVYTVIEHNDETNWNGWWSETTDADAYIDADYRPRDDFFDLDERYGSYFINVTNENSKSIGNATFYVIDVEIFITPDKSKYVQGDEITIMVETSIEDGIDVHILDPEGEVLSSANWTDQQVTTGQWTKDYSLGNTIPDGEYEIQVIKDGNIMETKQFTVEKFNLNTIPDSGAYLPGETIKVYYSITNNKDGSGVTNAVLEWIFHYNDEKEGEWISIKDDKQSPGSHGMFTVSIPKTADNTLWGNLWVWANDTQDHSDSTHEYISIGSIDASADINGDQFVAGDFVRVDILAHVDGSDLRHGNVDFNVSMDGQEIAAYTKVNLQTDIEGDLVYIFVLQDNAEEGFYTISVNVSKEGTNEYDHAQDSFEVIAQRDMYIEVSFDNKYYTSGGSPLYYSGDTVSASYTVFRGDEVLNGLNCEYIASFNNNVISVGTDSTGEFSFNLPSGYKGYVEVWLECTNSEGTKVSETTYIMVEGTGLIMTPNTRQYKAKDTIKVEYTVVGTEIPNAQYFYEIRASGSGGEIVRRGNLEPGGGFFTFTIPDGDIPNAYYIVGYMTDQNGVQITSTELYITKLMGYILTFTLDKETYRPGETATLKYKITSLNDLEVPERVRLTYRFEGGVGQEVWVTKPQGTLKLKVPNNAPDGEGYFTVDSDITPAATQEANIRESPNPLAGTVGDLSLMEILLLIFVLIALIFGIGGYMKGKKALNEAKLPPWKKEGSLPEPEKFKESEPTPEPIPEPMPEPESTAPPPGDIGGEPPSEK